MYFCVLFNITPFCVLFLLIFLIIFYFLKLYKYIFSSNSNNRCNRRCYLSLLLLKCTNSWASFEYISYNIKRIVRLRRTEKILICFKSSHPSSRCLKSTLSRSGSPSSLENRILHFTLKTVFLNSLSIELLFYWLVNIE